MKPTHIFSVLDTALKARSLGYVFNPMFAGQAGLGKSQICQSWVKRKRQSNPNFGFIDLRIAYMEAPDLIGLPENEKDEDGLVRTKHRLPEFWPTDENSEGLLLFEEPNRGTTGVMNCLMQILTDRKIHNYTLPKGWMIAACVNPDDAEYDVSSMDTALKDRFEIFDVEYDHLSFLEFMENEGWDDKIQRFVSSGIWIYKDPAQVGKDGKYISPRTMSKLEAAEKSDIAKNRQHHRLVVTSILGKDIGNEYHKFSYDQAPVTAEEILKDKKAAFKKLKDQSDKDNYKGDMIAATVESIVKNYGGLKKDCKDNQIDEDTMAEVAKIIPSDQAVVLIKECGAKQSKNQLTSFFKEFVTRHPELVQVLRDNIKITRATTAAK